MMMEILVNCPVCNSVELLSSFQITDYSISKEVFNTSVCNECEFLFTNPRPNQDGISKYYESTEYISHSNTKRGLTNKIYQVVRQYSIKKKIDLVASYNDAGKILDIGCGTGEFLSSCKKRGWITKGIEPNDKARSYSHSEYGLDVINESEIIHIPSGSFETITMWHVLEHVHHLKKRIEEVSLILKNRGIAVVAVPNHESFDASHYGKYWAAYDIPRHLYHFSAANIKQLFNQYNFEWIKSVPMRFDSFYVSILSEKYRSNKFPFINGLNIGLKSNLMAGKNPEKFSSVIYIFRKKN
jgi:2-polyprenyl-3-methyl-5-hydroxy-6-metoxy-1,4-benzoquinol methylase